MVRTRNKGLLSSGEALRLKVAVQLKSIRPTASLFPGLLDLLLYLVPDSCGTPKSSVRIGSPVSCQDNRGHWLLQAPESHRSEGFVNNKGRKTQSASNSGNIASHARGVEGENTDARCRESSQCSRMI
ncbi:hypothetical protein STEG23_036064 [Scotinomys teguina]